MKLICLFLTRIIVTMCSENEFVFIAGDLNARTGSLSDYIPNDRFLNEMFDIDGDSRANFEKYRTLKICPYLLIVVRWIKKINARGLMLIDLYRNNNLFIVNGHLGKYANAGHFTFREKSVIDYLITTVECF